MYSTKGNATNNMMVCIGMSGNVLVLLTFSSDSNVIAWSFFLFVSYEISLLSNYHLKQQ